MSSDGLKPITIASSPPLLGGAMGGTTTPTTSQHSTNNDAKRDNPFLQFVAGTRYIWGQGLIDSYGEEGTIHTDKILIVLLFYP